MKEKHAKYNILLAAFVFLVVLFIYTITVAPTVSFWDCGEYIGSSHSLGIPHPPGNPLYVLLGRVFSIVFFFFKQVAFRVNLISVFAASFTAMLIYLIIVRVMISWMGEPDTNWKRITVYLAGVVGAFFCAFGYTFWFSSVEASVYIPSMLIIVLCIWLALMWSQSKDPDRDRILLLFAYLAFLGIGIHMFAMIALIPIFPFILMNDRNKLTDWRLWITCILMASVIYHVSMFLWIGPLVTILTLVMSLTGNENRKKWRFCFWIAFLALLGYSVHMYIPVRSALEPVIDENHPVVEFTESGVKWDAFKGFLERKQYGSESMVVRMFWRRGSWKKQFGVDGHMGYGGFHLTQFFHFGRSVGTDRAKTVFENWGPSGGFFRLLIYLIPTMFMLYGWYYLYNRNKTMAIFLIFLFLLTSAGLVLYMNFADGFHAEKRDFLAWVRSGKQGPMPTVHREVRIRDYFFTPGFMFFGMWIGLAVGSLLHALFTAKNTLLRTQLAPIIAVLFAVSPALPLTQNFNENNRRFDWVPYDYAYNLLMSCEKDGILITNGDNDTFPLWFLQEAEGIRRDVRIVNLSLLNTKWYIKQLKKLEPKVPISFSEQKIDALTHELNPIAESIPYTMSNAGITISLPGRKEKNALRVQDKMVLHIVDANKWRKPIYFAVTVSNDNMMGLQPYLQMQGLAYRIMRHRVPGNQRLDLERTTFLLDKVYLFRGLGASKEPMNETTQKLLSNYAASFIQLALSLRQPLSSLKDEIARLETALADTTAADSIVASESLLAAKRKEYNEKLDLATGKLSQCISLMPWDWRPRALQQEILMAHGRYEEALEKIRQARKIEPDNLDYLKMEAQILDRMGKRAEANEILRKLAENEADSWNAYALLCRNYEEMGLYDSAITVMEQFLELHPGDRRAGAMIARLNNIKQAMATRGLDSQAAAPDTPVAAPDAG
jgi:tetratricopeptide (TPR) repeat protein